VACGDAKPLAFWDGGSASSVPATAPGEAPTVASLESVQVRAIG